MPRDTGVYLQDILEAVARIRSYTEGLSYEAFEIDEKTTDAVLRNLEISSSTPSARRLSVCWTSSEGGRTEPHVLRHPTSFRTRTGPGRRRKDVRLR
jgi:hypothetical protein